MVPKLKHRVVQFLNYIIKIRSVTKQIVSASGHLLVLLSAAGQAGPRHSPAELAGLLCCWGLRQPGRAAATQGTVLATSASRFSRVEKLQKFR